MKVYGFAIAAGSLPRAGAMLLLLLGPAAAPVATRVSERLSEAAA